MGRIGWASSCLLAVLVCAVGAALLRSAPPPPPPPGEPSEKPEPPPADAAPPDLEPMDFEPRDRADREPTEVRVYDVSDLVGDSPAHPFVSGVVPPTGVPLDQSRSGGSGGGLFGGGGLYGGGGGERPNVNPDAITTERLIALIREMVAPGNWQDSGGNAGAMRSLEQMLVIDQTKDNHRAVAALLENLRRARGVGRGVDVQAYWVLVTAEDLKAILKGDAAAGAGREVDPAALEKLRDEVVFTRGAVRCVSGATVQVLSGRARAIVRDQNASVGTGVAAYDPEMEQVLAGTVLRLTPRVKGDWAVVDVATDASEWREPGSPIRLGSQQGTLIPATQPSDVTMATRVEMSADVDRTDMTAAHLATTARLPLGRPVLVGGMTLEPTAGNSAKAGDARQLYLILRVTADEEKGGKANPEPEKEAGR